MNTNSKYTQKILLTGFFMSIVALRVVPHIGNAMPLFALIAIFTLNYQLPKSLVAIVAIPALLLSDLLLAYFYHYPIFGTYSWFTYSGMLLAITSSRRGRNLPLGLFTNTIATSTGYWIWTNLGVWLLADIYPFSTAGLWQCYIMAIPFLKNAVITNVIGIAGFLALNLCCLNTRQGNGKHNILYQGTTR